MTRNRLRMIGAARRLLSFVEAMSSSLLTRRHRVSGACFSKDGRGRRPRRLRLRRLLSASSAPKPGITIGTIQIRCMHFSHVFASSCCGFGTIVQGKRGAVASLGGRRRLAHRRCTRSRRSRCRSRSASSARSTVADGIGARADHRRVDQRRVHRRRRREEGQLLLARSRPRSRAQAGRGEPGARHRAGGQRGRRPPRGPRQPRHRHQEQLETARTSATALDATVGECATVENARVQCATIGDCRPQRVDGAEAIVRANDTAACRHRQIAPSTSPSPSPNRGSGVQLPARDRCSSRRGRRARAWRRREARSRSSTTRSIRRPARFVSRARSPTPTAVSGRVSS